ncbi:MAG TPA: thiamine diphosphokinase [Coriobacteriia bacterium]|nr:thiamine diphosphokinase [Coriobacteriia bacterium]
MNALVIGASPVPGCDDWYRDLTAQYDLVVACDAAGEWSAALGRVPDVAVGDFDSAETGAEARLRARGAEVLTFPARKDASDLELAVDVSLGRGATSVTVTAAFTNRLDHTLAAVGCALRVPSGVEVDFRDPGVEVRVLDARSKPGLELDLAPGTLVSVVALTPAEGVTLRGLEYPLTNASLAPLASRGISNVAIAPRVTVTAMRGTLLVICVDESRFGIQVPTPPCR